MRRAILALMCGFLVLLPILLAGCDGEDSEFTPQAQADAEMPGPVASGEPEPVLPVEESGAATDTATTGTASESTERSDVAGTPPEDPATKEPEAGGSGRPLIDGVVEAGEYVHELSIGGMSIHWANDAQLLHVGLVSPGTGYVTAGFDPTDRKVGGNYIIGYVTETETVVVDHAGTRGNLHEADVDLGGTDDIVAFAGTETNGETTIEFTIPLDSGDPYDRTLAPGGTYTLLVAYQDTRDDLISWHSRHGMGEITLDP